MDATSVAEKIWKDSYLFETEVHALVRCGEEEPKYRLAYMAMRNRGEILRLMLEESGVSYDLEVIGFKDWERGVKASTPQGKCPVLRNYDGLGTDLGQEGAITRFLAKELELFGKTPVEESAVDSLYCFWFSTLRNNGVSHDGEHFSIASLRDAPPSSERPVYREIFRINSLSRADRSLMALGFFEDQLEATGSGFLVGQGVTCADLGLFYILFELAEEDNVPDFADKFDLPRLGAFLEHMQNRPNIRAYLNSPRRMPRYARDASGSSLYTYVPGKGSPRR